MDCKGLRLFIEMITVVLQLQLKYNILLVHFVAECQLTNRLIEIAVQFLIGDAADVDIAVIHGDIGQIVQVAEHTHLAKRSYARESRT